MHINVISRTKFFELLNQKNINESNVESFSDFAFISIINTTDKLYNKKEYKIIPFEKNHSNVLVLSFDDVSYTKETVIDDGILNGTYISKPINKKQCKQIIEFVENNIYRKQLIIHCTAGISRSGAVGLFISDHYLDKSNRKIFEEDNAHIRPNFKVFSLLKTVYNELKYDYPI